MSVIKRIIQKKIENRLQAGKVIIIAGARRTGKTVLVKEIINNTKVPGAWVKNYPLANYHIISRENYLPFILKKDFL